MADTTSSLDPQYVEEVDETVAPAARQVGNWTAAYAKAQMDEFASTVTTNSKAAVTANTNAQKAAQATATDAAKTATAVMETKQQVAAAEAQVELAETEVTKAHLEAMSASGYATDSAQSAAESEDAYRRVKALIDAFDPGLNQYGYSKTVYPATDVYLVTEKDLGKTLVFDRNARIVLPASGRSDFPESFFFHVTTVDAGQQVWVSYDLATTLTTPSGTLPYIEGAKRGTIQLLTAGKWRLYDPIHVLGDELSCQTELDYVGQCRQQSVMRENIDGDFRYGLVKQYGNLYAMALDLNGGGLYSKTVSASRVTTIPDGPLELIYSASTSFTGKVLFGLSSNSEAFTGSHSWFWGDSGFTGNIYPLNFEGYAPSDWWILEVNASVSAGVKYCWVRFASRNLTDLQGNPVEHCRVFTSTDGYNWFANRFSQINTKLGTQRLIAHFPQSMLESGEYYYERTSDGAVVKCKYVLTPNTWTETVVADGFDELVQCKFWNATNSYSLVFAAGSDLVCFAHSGSTDTTVTTTINNVAQYTSWLGDSPRCVSVAVMLSGETDVYKYQWVLNDEYPNGSLLTTHVDVATNTSSTLLYAGTVLFETGDLEECVFSYDPDTKLTSCTIGTDTIVLPQFDQAVFGVGKYLNANSKVVKVILTDLGLWFNLDLYNEEAEVDPTPTPLVAPTYVQGRRHVSEGPQ